jgi:hypothetical protein
MTPHSLSKIFRIAAIAFLFFPPLRTAAGELPQEPGAFGTVSVAVDAVGGGALGSFEDYWSPSAGGRLEVATPFYAGVLRAGGHLFDNDASAGDVPSFGALWSYLGWSYEWLLPRRVILSTGVQTGLMYMDFDDETIHEARQDETELGFGADARVRYAFAGSWSVFVGGEYRVVLTEREIGYVFGGVGIARAFASPKWLKEFLE